MALRPVHRAVLSVIRPQPDATFPLEAALALDASGRAELLRELRRHGLSGWAHRRFRDGGVALPDDLARPLAQDHAGNQARSIVQLEAYARISRLLSDAGLEHIPLKGIRLLETLYPDPGTRQLSDVDVLVRRRDVESADRALRAAGYRGEASALWERQRRFHHHHGYDAPAPFPAHLELHWRVSSSFDLGSSPDRLWDHAIRPEPATSPQERALPAPVHLHSLLIHAAHHGYGISLKWVLDLRRWLEVARDGTREHSPARTDGMREHSPARGDGMREHSPARGDDTREHSPAHGDGMREHSPARRDGEHSPTEGMGRSPTQTGLEPLAHDLAARARAAGTVGPCLLVLGLVQRLAGSAEAARLVEALRPRIPTPRTLLLDRITMPERFFGGAGFLRRRYMGYTFVVWLADGVTPRLRALLGPIQYKLSIEGLLPGGP